MHGSTSSQRSRQRPSTSCTECRRRKQKCNQAKDRPCNNCARRYPPVVCTYDSGGSSRGSTAERVDLDEDCLPDDTIQGQNHSYNSASHASGGYVASNEHYDSSHAYCAPVQSSTGYYAQDQAWSNQYTASSTVSYNPSYYGTSGAQVGDQAYDSGYYGNTYAQQGNWTASADPRVYTGSTMYDEPPISSSRRNEPRNS